MDSLEHATSLATILELSRLVCSTLDLDEVFARILEAVHNLSGTEIVSLMLLDEQGERLRFVAAYGLPPEQLVNPSFRLGEGVAGWVALHGTPVHTASLRDDKRFIPIYTPPQATLFVLPLKVRSRTLGVLNLAGANDGKLFSPEMVQTVEIFASHAAIAIDNAAAATSLRYAAIRERVARLVHQAPREPGAAGPVIAQILAEVTSPLELAWAAVFGPQGEALYSTGEARAGRSGLPQWQPADPEAEVAETRDERDCTLQVRLCLADSPPHWLVLLARLPTHFWRRDERELARFAADQIALLLANERLVLQEQHSRSLNQTLSQLAAACNAMVGQESLLDYILEQLARYIAYDSSGVFLFHDNHYARMVAGHGFHQRRSDRVIYTGPGSVSWAVREDRRAIYLPDVQQVAGWQHIEEEETIRAWIGAPLLVNNVVMGMLTIDKWSPDAFSATDVALAQLFADHVAVAFNNQMLLRNARTRASQIQLLHQLSLRMGLSHEPEELLDEVARLLQTAFGYYQVWVLAVEQAAPTVKAAYGAVNKAEAALVLKDCGSDLGLAGHVALTGKTILVNDIAQDSRYVPHPWLRHTAAGLVAAIKPRDQVLGVIIIESDQKGAFSQHDVYLIEAVASQTGLALEHLRHNEELRRTEERLAQSERLRALGELASGVAHDFNNLLASIVGHTQLLLGEPLDPTVAEELRVIERAALDGAASVRRLQGFAQTSRSLPVAAVNLDELVAESLAITRPRWRDAPQSRGVAMTVSHEPGGVPPFAADGPALRDLATNLVLNAIDAMPQGGQLRLLTAALSTEHSPLGLPTAMIEVSDTGVGMPPEVLERIFEPFFTTKGPHGTGMGLTMVRGIVQRHQGRISVSSEPGRGTTFRVYLPARTAPPLAAPAPNLTVTTGSPRQVLVVDDDDAVRRVLARQIGRLGHQVAEASSGEAALALLARSHFDLICTDLGMPGMSGWELIARARELDEGLLAVLVTGWGEQIDPELARAQGAAAVLAKPFDLGRLKQVIDALPS